MPLQRLPSWVQLGAFFLAVNAGMINVLGLVTVLHQSVSHMTGNVSMLAMALLDWQPRQILYLILVTLCYVIGSMYSGLILGNSHFRLGHLYGYPLSLVAFLYSFAGYYCPISRVMPCYGPVSRWAYKMPWSVIIKVRLSGPHICLVY